MLFLRTPQVSAMPREPQFLVEWEPRVRQFRSSWAAFFSGPKAPKKFHSRYFRDSEVNRPVAAREIYLSVLLHAGLIAIVSLPIWTQIFQGASAGASANTPAVEVTWYRPARDLPPLVMPGPAAAPSPAGQPAKPLPHRGASAFHPRQTILSQPLRLTHPRQVLIQPDAPNSPPKIIPQLPNIVEWHVSAPQPARPRYGRSTAAPRARLRAFPKTPAPDVSAQQKDARGPQFTAASPMHEPRAPLSAGSSSVPQRNNKDINAVPVPAMTAQEQNSAGLNFPAAPATHEPRVPLPVASSARPQLTRKEVIAGPAPEVGEGANGRADSSGVPANSGSIDQPRVPASGVSSAHPVLNRKAENAGPAPEIEAAGDSSNRRIIALSATPAPVPPTVVVPKGNLSARISISPEGSKSGAPGGSPVGQLNSNGGSGGGPTAPGGTGGSGGTQPIAGGGGKDVSGQQSVTVSPGNPANTAPVTGPEAPGSTLPSSPAPHIVSPTHVVSTNRSPSSAGTAGANSPAGGPAPVNPMKKPSPRMDELGMGPSPEQILGDKRIYTLYINMPNLTSAAGSWVLNFAELNEDSSMAAGDLAGPVPVRKVDPRYPTSLINAHVEGEVVLYAIIRSDGSVDSIQLLRGLDPDLDQNAMEALTHWKFRPATRGGAPVDLEAVVHIPFRSSTGY